jgi:hypothetical protein
MNMLRNKSARRLSGYVRFLLAVCMLVLASPVPKACAQASDEFDSYKIRLEGFWVYSNPSGTLQSSVNNGAIDLQKDLGFNNYSTFVGKLDWKFTHKNHLYLVGIPFNSSRQTVLARTIVFQGQTFEAGLTTTSSLTSPMIGFGYQYDIIRRKRGHLGIGAQINVFDSHASIKAAAQVTSDGVHHDAVSSSASLLAPIPVAGLEFRLYLTNSPRLFVEGNAYGMYFFGYGNYVSSAGTLGLTLTRHLSANAGYQLGSRLVVENNGSSNRIGLNMTQQGPLVGLELSF